MTDEPMVETISEEELLEQEILEQPDAEQIISKDLQKVGQPIKYVLVRSALLNKQVLMIPDYYELCDGDETIGYQRFGENKLSGEYGPIATIALNIIGTRQRGE